jgi:hypothetical protein
MNNDQLYNRIDAEDDMTDSEKRAAYFNQLADDEMFGDEFSDDLGDLGDK